MMASQILDDTPTPNYQTIVRNSVRIWPSGTQEITTLEERDLLDKIFPGLDQEPLLEIEEEKFHHKIYDGKTLLVIVSVYSRGREIRVANRPKCLKEVLK
jgi:hypothetical protein